MTDLSPEEQRRISTLAEKWDRHASWHTTSRSLLTEALTEQALSHARDKETLTAWFNLGRLTVEIANGRAMRSSAKELDDNPVNCISAVLSERDELKRRVEELQLTKSGAETAYEEIIENMKLSDDSRLARISSLEAALKVAKTHITNALGKLPTDHLLVANMTLEPVRKSLNQAYDSLSRLTGAPKGG